MAPTDVDKLIEDWVLAWSSPTTLEKLVALFTDDGGDEDLPLGVLAHGDVGGDFFFRLKKFTICPLAIENHVAHNQEGPFVAKCFKRKINGAM